VAVHLYSNRARIITTKSNHGFLTNINIKGAVMCINYAQIKRQLGDALLQLKSLQK
jgi:hypothetical protein